MAECEAICKALWAIGSVKAQYKCSLFNGVNGGRSILFLNIKLNEKIKEEHVCISRTSVVKTCAYYY